MSTAQDWKVIAKLRRAEGDEEGAQRAERNARAYVGRTYASAFTPGGERFGLRTVWSEHRRPIRHI